MRKLAHIKIESESPEEHGYITNRFVMGFTSLVTFMIFCDANSE